MAGSTGRSTERSLPARTRASGSAAKGSGAKASSGARSASSGAKGASRNGSAKGAASSSRSGSAGSARSGAKAGSARTTSTKAATTKATAKGSRSGSGSGKAGRAPAGRPRPPVSDRAPAGVRRPIGGRAPAPWVERLFAAPNVDGPRVRMGIVWILVAIPAVWFGPTTTALLFGFVALIASLQSGQAWNKAGYRTSRPVAALAAVGMPAAALLPRPAAAGLVLIALPVLALAAALATPPRRRRTSAIAAAGATVCSAAPAGVAAAGMVAVTDLGRPTALVLLALVSAYEMGSFVFGAESPYPSHAILAGAGCTMVLVAPIWVFRLQPFDGRLDVWIFGGLVAVLAPLGPVVASAALPSATTWVPALRRLDAYIVVAPLWASAMWSYLA